MNNLLWLLQLGAHSHAGSQSLTCLSVFLHARMKVSQPWGGGCNVGRRMKKKL